MKKVSFVLFAIVLSIGCIMAQENLSQKGNAQFKNTVHDFGKVAEEVGSVSCEFVFTNIGKQPIVIQEIRTSCGCTTPSYTKDPVLPGKTGVIKVTYSTIGRPNAFNKTITVFTNEPDQEYKLYIKGEVIPRK